MNDAELLRYSRQILLPQIDIAGQQALLESRALIVGLGGLGSPVALYLAAAGVGQLVLADGDQVDSSNLQRQIVHTESDLGRAKVDSAAANLRRLNSGVQVTALAERLAGERLLEQVQAADVVLDCSDNFTTRQQVNAACVQSRKPLVSGAAIRFEGQVVVFDSRRQDSACYHCLYGSTMDDNLSCQESGVVAPLVGIIGSIQALEAIKLLTGAGQPLVGKLMLLDAMSMNWQTLAIPRQPDCPVCA